MISKPKFFYIVVVFLLLSIITGCPAAKNKKEKSSSPSHHTLVQDNHDHFNNSNEEVLLKKMDVPRQLPEAKVLRVATFNCEWLFDNDPSDQEGVPPQIKALFPKTRKEYIAKLHRVAAVLIGIRAHVYALQEIEDADVLQDLAQILEYNLKRKYEVCFKPGGDRYTRQNVGILSAYPVLDVRRFKFQRGSRVTKHLSVTIEVMGEKVQIITLHLKAGSHERNFEKRAMQAKAIHAQIQRYVSSRNIIVMGDLNTHIKFKPKRKKKKRSKSKKKKNSPRKDADYYLTGKHTRRKKDDLIDINQKLERAERITHGERGQYDRILLSPPIFEDDPNKKDLYFIQAGRWKVDPKTSDHHALWAEFDYR
ncbi:MAG: hypothetical protein D6785_07365 [Planctomycetota bacterium]|nr:MAG: hypothetical protein D6785_07365 [Planctomycetota bacterium]